MKLTIKLLIIVAIVAVIAPLFIKGPDGKPLMQPSDLLPVDILPHAIVEPLGITPGTNNSRLSSPQTPTPIYRWQDDKGQWHYGDTPPAHIRSESVTLQPLNTVPALKTPKQQNGNTSTRLQSDTEPKADTTDLTSALPSSLNPSDAAALLEQAKETQRIIQERQAQIDALMNNQ